jgi:hypothetical protein
VGPGRLQALGHDHDHPAGELEAESGIGFAAAAHGRGVAFEQFGRLNGHRPELPLERREEPGHAEHVTAPQGLDDGPAVPGRPHVDRDLARTD